MMEKKRIYLNDAQYYLLSMAPRNLIAVCGRGIGKGVIQASRLLEFAQAMPRCSLGFVVPSVKRGLTNILPSILMHLNNWGYKKDIHYCIGHRPAKAWHWAPPIWEPENYENVIQFYNGSYVTLISQDRVGTSNSMSLDGIIIDEAKFIDYEQLKNETFQANRGNEMYFSKCYLHHGMTVTSDMPVTKAGSWFLNYEQQMDKDLVKLVEGLVYQIWKTKRQAAAHPERKEYYNRKLGQLRATANEFRAHLTLYKEYSSIENLAILGKQFFYDMKRNLPVLTFATSILGLRLGISMDGFYSGLRPVNLYTAPNISHLDNLHYDFTKLQQEDCRMDNDVDPGLPLIIAFDANANINWCVVGQVGDDGKLRVIKSFYVKYERKIPELVDDFCRYYMYYTFKQVIFYYDTTFISNNYALHNDDFHATIVSGLRREGWYVNDVCIGKQMGHIEKQALINRMFMGRAAHQVLINKDNNRDLLLSIQTAGVYMGKKDKRGEKLAETEEDKLENRTDGSDAFDTLCIGVEKFPKLQLRMGGAVVSSFGGH